MFFFLKSKEAPQKARIFLSAEPLKSLEKKGNAQKKVKLKNKKNTMLGVFVPIWPVTTPASS